MRKKRFLSLLLGAVMTVGLLVGCQGSGQDVQTENTDGEAAADQGGSASSSGKTTLTFMCSGVKASDGDDFQLDLFTKIVEEKYPDVNVEVTKLPDDQYYTALKTKLSTGEAPDLIWVQPQYAGVNATYSLAEAGYLVDISDLNAVELVGSAVDSFTYNDKVYALPGGISFLGTFYNKDMFEEHNLEIPTNWDEFLNCCQVLQDAGIQPIVMGDKDMYVMQFGLYQLAANMVYPQTPDYDQQLRDGKIKFTDDGIWEAVLERYYSLYELGYIQGGSLGLGSSQSIQKFIDGECAMTFSGTFNTPAVQAAGAAEFERGFFPLPGNESDEDLYVAGAPGAGPAIYSGSDNIELCKEILELWYDGTSELYEAYETCGKFISTNEGAQVDPLYDGFMDLYAQGQSYYWCNQAWPAGTENEMEELFGEMIGGIGTTAGDITAGMQNKFEELLKDESTAE